MEAKENQHTTVNRELGEWIRRLRCQWMSRNPDNWRRPWRFFYGLAGSATVFGAWTIDGIPTTRELSTMDIVSAVSTGVVFPVWFAWLISWKNFNHGPVRLYLSGIFLSALVLYLTHEVVQRF